MPQGVILRAMKPVLPIDAFLPHFAQTLMAHPSVVLSAAPGAGKTTRIPPEILKLTDKEVWVLEPRRIAAIAAAQRIAEENNFSLGGEVGYQVRFENKFSRDTRLLFLTEALLLRKLLQDPELARAGCIVLDEFHERSLHLDLALGALRELQQLSRPDLKLVVMSATLDAQPLAKYLGNAPVIEVPGKIYPLTIRHEEKSQLLQTNHDFIEQLRRLCGRALSENLNGDLLCFLPGRGEIERLRTALVENLPEARFAVFALHGQLSLQEQKQALAPLVGRRKIILATNVAESSLTVEGVRIVVDSGLARLQQQHPRTGYESLDLVRISKASAIQRAGRAARQGPGTVYRAWSLHDEKSMNAFEVPEIQRLDLSEALLLLAALGVTKPESFSWFELPPSRALLQAQKFLQALGAISPQGLLTPLGQKLRAFPLHPRLAKLLLLGKEKNIPGFAADLAALLSEGKGHKNNPNADGRENDLLARWEDWKRDGHRHRNLNRAAEQLRQLVGASDCEEQVSERVLDELLLEIYPDRLCRRRRAGSEDAKLVGGRGVRLHSSSSVKQSEYFLALELAEGRDAAHAQVFQAVGIAAELVREKIEPFAVPSLRIEWDQEKFWAFESREWNGLPIGSEHRRPAGPDEVKDNLVSIAIQRLPQISERNEALANWLARLEFLHERQSKWPLLTEEQIREALAMACFGENSLAPLETKDLVPYFESLLEEEHLSALQRECPASWLVPSGNRFRIQYSKEQGPMVEVRLQELFGLRKPPMIAEQALTLVLLAPNYRPVQVTRDLESFWNNAYSEVRKELRMRYPKHSWPEDPLAAAPQSKGRPRDLLAKE